MAETVEKLKVELDINAGSFNKQMGNINKEIKRSESEFKQASKGVKNFENSFTGLDNKIQKTAKQLDLYSTKLTKQKSEYERLENVVEKQKSKLDELESTLGKGSKEWQKQEQLVQKNSEKLSKLGQDIGKTENNIEKLSGELKDSQQAFEELGNKTKSAGEKLADIDNKAALAESEFNKLGSELEQNGTFFQKLGNEMNQLSSKIDTQVQKINVYENEIEQLGNELKQNKNTHEQLATEIKQTEQALNKAQSEYGQNSTEAQQLRSKLLSLKDSYNQVETEIEQGTRELNQYQTELNQTQTEVNNLSRELRQMPFDEAGNKLKETGQGLKSVGSSLTSNVTVPIIAAGTAAGVMAYDYDQGLAKVGSLVNKSGKQMKEYDGIIKDMSHNTGISLSELTESMYQGISAGGDLNNIFKLTEVASKSAIGGYTSTDVAIDGLTSSMNAFGLEYIEVDKVANKFLLTQNKGKTSFGELAGAIGKVAPTAKAAGVSLDELLSATAALTMNGIATSEAMTALKAGLSNVIKPSTEAQKMAKSLGLEFNVAALQSKGLAGFLKDIEKACNGDIEKMGKLFGSTEALNAMLILTGDGAETFTDVLGDMGGELNLVDSAFEGMTEGSGAKFKKSINDIKVALVDMGDKLAPVITWLSEKISQLASWFSELDDSTQQNIVTFGLLAAAIGPILSGIGTLLIVGGNAVTLFGGLSAATAATTTATVAATGATIGLSTVLLPIAGIIAGVVAAIGALNWANEKYTEHLESKAINSVEYYIDKLNGISPAASEAGQKITDLEKNTSDIIVDVILGQNLEQRVPEVKALLEETVIAKNEVIDQLVQKDLEYFDFMISITEGGEKAKYEELKQGAINSINARKEGFGEEVKAMQEHWDKVLKGEEAYTSEDLQLILEANQEKINAEIENNAELQKAIENGDKNVEELRTRARAESVAAMVESLTTERQAKLDAIELEKTDRLAAIEADNTLDAETRAKRIQQVSDMYNEKMQLTRDNNAAELALLQEMYDEELGLYSLKNGEFLTAKQQNDATLMEMTRLNNEAELSGLDLHYTRRGKTVESMTTAEKNAIETSNAAIKASYDAEFKASGMSLYDFERTNGSVTSRIEANEKKIKTANSYIKTSYAEAFKASGMSLGAFEAKYGTLDAAIRNNKDFALDANGKIKASTTKEFNESIKKLKEMGLTYDQTTGNITDGSGKIIASNVDATKAADELSKKDADVKKLGKAFITSGNDATTGNAKTGSSADTASTKVDNLAKKYNDFAKKPNISKTITVNEVTNKTTNHRSTGTPSKKSIVQAMSSKLSELSTTYDFNIPNLDVSNYKLAGGYYSRESNASTTMINNLNADIRRLEKYLNNDKESNITVNFNFDKVEIKNNDDYKTMAKKVAGYVDIELNKIKNKNKKIKGRLVNA